MDYYKIYFKKSAEKEIRRITKPRIKLIIKKIQTLSKQPRPFDSIMLRGEDRYYRVRSGDYRIIYEVNDLSSLITIIKIGHRNDIYKTK